MAFPTSPVLDDFNTGANQGLSTRAGWLNGVRNIGFSDFTTDAVPTKAVAAGGGSNGDNVWGTQFTNVEVYVTIADWPGAAGSFYLYARWGTSAAQNGYRLHLFSGFILADVMTSGSASNLFTTASAVGVGDSMGMSCVGSTISAYTKIGAGDWSLLNSATDATYSAAGNIGVVVDSGGNNLDAFGGGAFVPVGAPARDTHTAIPFTKGAGGGGKI